jgi:hypothetical protein
MANSGQPGAVTDVTRQLADKSRQVASRLEECGVQGVGDDLRRFARRQPGLFLAAAGVAGFVVTRLLRNAQGNALSGAQSAAPSTSSHPGLQPFTSTQAGQQDIGLPTGAPASPETTP